jgi:hypothetical protein
MSESFQMLFLSFRQRLDYLLWNNIFRIKMYFFYDNRLKYSFFQWFWDLCFFKYLPNIMPEKALSFIFKFVFIFLSYFLIMFLFNLNYINEFIKNRIDWAKSARKFHYFVLTFNILNDFIFFLEPIRDLIFINPHEWLNIIAKLFHFLRNFFNCTFHFLL